MIAGYHRRIRIFPKDVVALAWVKLGCGANLSWFYMFRGGPNPDAQLSPLNESQAKGDFNDVPVKSYDFGAPLGEFGQVREYYHELRCMSLFLHDYGEALASMMPVFAGEPLRCKDDVETLYWCVRGDGFSAFLFCNNYQRLQPMPSKPGTLFHVQWKGGEATQPRHGATVAADSFFVWPVNLNLGGVRLVYVTAELLCRLDNGDARYVFFSEITGIPAEFAFEGRVQELVTRGKAETENGRVYVEGLQVGPEVSVRTLNEL